MKSGPPSWIRSRIEDLCTVTRGASPRPIQEWMAPSGTPWIKIADATGAPSRQITKTKGYIRNEGRARSVVVYPGDFILSNSATPGIPKFVGIEACIHDGWLLLRSFRDVNPNFLYYTFLNDRAELAGQGNGSIFTNLKTEIVKRHEVLLPPLAEQQAIADVLGALDDKIAANTKLADTADRFLAAHFSRLIAEASTIRLGEIATVNPVSCRPVRGGSLRYIDISSVGMGTLEFPEISNWDDAPSRARRHVQLGDTLWSTVRPNRRSHALNLSPDQLLVGSTGLAVLRPRDTGFAYLYEATKTPSFTAYLENVAEGSAYPAVRAKRFEDAPIEWIAGPERESFEMTADPLRRTLQSLDEENFRLASVRDALLPQLMSGRLSIRQAEDVLAAQK